MNMKIHSYFRGLTGGEREKGSEKIFEDIVAENFPNKKKETVTEVQDV